MNKINSKKKNVHSEQGVSLFLVLAALIVTGLLGSAMLKLSTSDAITNATYSTSATARSAAQSGIVAAISKLESTDPTSNIIPTLQHWIDASATGATVEPQYRWLNGSATQFETLQENLEYRTQILGFDKTNFTVSLRSEGKGRGGAKAIATAVYKLEGLELTRTNYPTNALQADGGIHEGNPEFLTINGGTSINWSGNYEFTSLNSKVIFNGPFRCDSPSRPFKLNGSYQFKDVAYFRNVHILDGAHAYCSKNTYTVTKSGTQPIEYVAGTGAHAVSSLQKLGLPAGADPAITFNRTAITPILAVNPTDRGGNWMNTLWENTPTSQKYKGEYIVLRINRVLYNNDDLRPFKNDGVKFKYKAIIIADGATRLDTFYDSDPDAVTVLYVNDYQFSEKVFQDITSFYGYLHVNRSKSEEYELGFVIGKADINLNNPSASFNDVTDATKFQLDFYGSIYCSANAKLRFEGVPVWAALSPTQKLAADKGSYFPGNYTINFRSTIVEKITNDGIITVQQRAGTSQTELIKLKSDTKSVSANLLSQTL